MPKRVLFVTYRFPPHGGAGVHRIAHLAKDLPPLGWQPHVVTGPYDAPRRLDPTLLDLIPSDVQVTRTGYTDGHRWVKRMGTLHLAGVTRALTPSFPAMDLGWVPHAVHAGTSVLKREGADLIFSCAYPMCSHLAAFALKKRFAIPWVADYRDEWSQRRVLSWPTPVHRAVASRIDRAITSAADRVVTTSPVHTASFARTFPSPDPGKYQTILNGFDQAKFDGRTDARLDGRPEGFLVCHVGSLFEYRDPGAFFQALRRALDGGAIPAGRVAVRFIGNTGSIALDRVPGCDVQHIDYVPHDTAVAWTREADVLLLVNHEPTNVLAKAFEYLASGRPVLALTKAGPTADLIRENDAGAVVDPDDVDAIERVLVDFYRRWSAGALPGLPTDAIFRKYSREASARRLVALFDSLM